MTIELPALPDSWSITRVDRVASVNARIGWRALTADEYQTDGYAFLSTPNIKSDKIDYQNVNFITEERYEESPELKLQMGDVLLAKDGNTLGIVNLVRSLPRAATVNGSIAVIRAFAIQPAFLRYVLESRPIQATINMLKGGMGVPHLFQWDINRLPIPLPPFAEQRRIADFLDAETARIDKLTAAQVRMVSLLKERETTVIEHAFTARQATHVRLKYLLRRPLSYGANEPAAHTNPDWPRYIRTTDIADDGTLRSDTFTSLPSATAKNYLLEDGDILLVRSGATVGKSFLYESHLGPAAHAGYLIRGSIDKKKIIPRLFWYFCQSSMYWQQIKEGALMATIQNVNAEKYGNLSVPICDMSTQKQIVDHLGRQVSRSRELQHRISKQQALLAEWRQALITAAVTGQFDVSTASGRGVTE